MDTKSWLILIGIPTTFVLIQYYGLPLLDRSAKYLWTGAKNRIEKIKIDDLIDCEFSVRKLMNDRHGLYIAFRYSQFVVCAIGSLIFLSIAVLFMVGLQLTDIFTTPTARNGAFVCYIAFTFLSLRLLVHTIRTRSIIDDAIQRLHRAECERLLDGAGKKVEPTEDIIPSKD